MPTGTMPTGPNCTLELAAPAAEVTAPPALPTGYGRMKESAPPPRFFYGKVIWLVCCLGQITTYFGTSAGITFIVDDLMGDMALSRSGVSGVYTAGTLVGALAQMPIGRAVDRYGGRAAIAVCSGAYALSLLCLSLPPSWPWLIAAFSALRALGFGGLALACTTCMQQWYVRRRGLATGLSEAASSFVGFGVLSSLLSALVAAYGWRRSYLCIGVVLMLTYVPLAALLLRSRPEDVGSLAVWLCGDSAHTMRGAALSMDGGWSVP